MNETSQQRKRRNGTNCLNGKWRNGKRKTSTEMDHGKENNCAGMEWNGVWLSNQLREMINQSKLRTGLGF